MKRTLYNYNNFVCTTVVAWCISHLSPNLLFRKLAQVRLLGASNYKKKEKKKREEKQKWTEFTDIFFLFAFASYNWAVTFPKQSQNALVRTPNLAFSSKANTTQAQEQQVLCQMKTATNAGATDKQKWKGREGKTLILKLACSPFKWPVKPAHLSLRLYMRLCLLSS